MHKATTERNHAFERTTRTPRFFWFGLVWLSSRPVAPKVAVPSGSTLSEALRFTLRANGWRRLAYIAAAKALGANSAKRPTVKTLPSPMPYERFFVWCVLFFFRIAEAAQNHANDIWQNTQHIAPSTYHTHTSNIFETMINYIWYTDSKIADGDRKCRIRRSIDTQRPIFWGITFWSAALPDGNANRLDYDLYMQKPRRVLQMRQKRMPYNGSLLLKLRCFCTERSCPEG